MAKVLVTGGSGKLGRAVQKDLVANGYSRAQHRPDASPGIRSARPSASTSPISPGGAGDPRRVDERRVRSMRWCTSRAIPAPGLFANSRTVANNVPTSYNVFEACRLAGSETSSSPRAKPCLGYHSKRRRPTFRSTRMYFPRPETAYSLGSCSTRRWRRSSAAGIRS